VTGLLIVLRSLLGFYNCPFNVIETSFNVIKASYVTAKASNVQIQALLDILTKQLRNE